jgi:hypothetical protein
MFKRQHQTHKQIFEDTLYRLENFKTSQWICSGTGNSALGIDENRLLICILSIDNKKQVAARIIPASQVLSAEIITDRESKSDVLLNQVTGAVIGGALFGDAGAIVGADSGKIMSAGIRKIALQLTINDMSNPFHRILFYPDLSRMFKNKERALGEAQRWQALMGILAKRAAEIGQPGLSPSPPSGRLPQPAVHAPEPARLPQPTAPPAQGQRCFLRPTAGVSQPPIQVASEPFMIGRSADNHLVLQDPSVSRQHAVLRFGNGTWFIQDRGSRAGTLVNGQYIQAARLSNGCRIGIGAQTFTFSIE